MLVGSPAGSASGAERFHVGIPLSPVDESDKKMRNLEKEITQLEAMIKEFITGGGQAAEDPWHRAKMEEAEAGKQHEDIKYKDDELRSMHPKDSKPPPEFLGARKDFMAWHESFTSMLRLRSSKRTRVIE